MLLTLAPHEPHPCPFRFQDRQRDPHGLQGGEGYPANCRHQDAQVRPCRQGVGNEGPEVAHGDLHLNPGMVIADIGSGTGLFTPLFSKAVGPKGKVRK